MDSERDSRPIRVNIFYRPLNVNQLLQVFQFICLIKNDENIVYNYVKSRKNNKNKKAKYKSHSTIHKSCNCKYSKFTVTLYGL